MRRVVKKLESVSFEFAAAVDRTVRGNVHPARNAAPEASVVVLHGFKAFKEWGMFPYVAEKLAETFDVVRINLSRCGVGPSLTEFDELEKFGRQTIGGDLEDVAAVVDRIRDGRLPLPAGVRQPLPSRVVLLGHSRGGGEAIVHALDCPDTVAGVVSWNGTVSFGEMFGEAALRSMREEGEAFVENARTKQLMPLTREIAEELDANANRYDIVGRIGTLRVPLVLVQGDMDHDRLLRGSERLTAANPAIRRIRVPGGYHTFGAVHPFAGTTAPLEAAIAATIDAIRGFA